MGEISLKAKLIDAGVNIDMLDAGMIDSFKLAVGGLAKAAQNEWIRLAQSRLQTSREDYVNGLRQAESFKRLDRGGGSIVYELQLVGKMPNNYEFGMPSFDMKAVRPGWLGGKKAKIAADGSTYVTIPFRHSTSGSGRMAYTGKAAAVKDPTLKQQLRKAVRDYGLDRMTRLATGQVVTGPTARIPNKAAVHPYLRGLTRYQQAGTTTTRSGKQKGSGSLMTFRRMSTKSKPGSWIHPGLEAANLMPEVESFIDSQIGQLIETMLGEGR